MKSLWLKINRPLLPVQTCMAAVDRGEDYVLSLIEEGKISWAFDFRGPKTGRRSMVRVFTASLSDHMNGTELWKFKDFPCVFNEIFGSSGETIAATMVAARWNCSATHVMNLVASRCLAAGTWRRGPNGSARITRRSLFDFVRIRRML